MFEAVEFIPITVYSTYKILATYFTLENQPIIQVWKFVHKNDQTFTRGPGIIPVLV